jgi:hypothetical protein
VARPGRHVALGQLWPLGGDFRPRGPRPGASGISPGGPARPPRHRWPRVRAASTPQGSFAVHDHDLPQRAGPQRRAISAGARGQLTPPEQAKRRRVQDGDAAHAGTHASMLEWSHGRSWTGRYPPPGPAGHSAGMSTRQNCVRVQSIMKSVPVPRRPHNYVTSVLPEKFSARSFHLEVPRSWTRAGRARFRVAATSSSTARATRWGHFAQGQGHGVGPGRRAGVRLSTPLG